MRTQLLRYRNSKVQRLRLNRHGLSWAERLQEAIFGESNVGGPSRRKCTGVGSESDFTLTTLPGRAVADINDRAWRGRRQIASFV